MKELERSLNEWETELNEKKSFLIELDRALAIEKVIDTSHKIKINNKWAK